MTGLYGSQPICYHHLIRLSTCTDWWQKAQLSPYHAHRQGRRSLWDRGTCPPNIYEGGTSMVMSPQNTVVCCILMQILWVVSQNSFSFWGTSSPDSLLGLRPWTGRWGSCTPVFFYVPPIILWDRRPCPSCYKQRCMLIVINWWWSLIELCWQQINVLWWNLSRGWDKAPQESTLIFGYTQISFQHNVRKLKEATMPKTSLIHSAVLINTGLWRT